VCGSDAQSSYFSNPVLNKSISSVCVKNPKLEKSKKQKKDGVKKWLSEYYGLLPQGKKVVVQKGNDNNYYTINNILFTAEKSKWNLNPYKCFGVLIHKACWDIINTEFGVELKLEMLAPYVSSRTNLLRNIEYWEQPCSVDENHQTNPLKKSDKGIENKKRIIGIWINFYNYQKNTYQRQQYCNRIKRTRYRSYNTRQMTNSQQSMSNQESSKRIGLQTNNKYAHLNAIPKSSSINKFDIFKNKILASLT